MRLYAGSAQGFLEDVMRNQIAEKMRNAHFYHFRYYPSPNEVTSWQNSLRPVADVIRFANLGSAGIILEYYLPYSSKRLDVLLCGRDKDDAEHAVITELKQWDRAEMTDSDFVMTWVGGGNREVLHPSKQVGQYAIYLKDMHTAFYGENEVRLDACSYLHNYHTKQDDPLLNTKYYELLEDYPLFSADNFEKYVEYLEPRVANGGGLEVMERIDASRFWPSKKLMDNVGKVIKSEPTYTLLDEQLLVYDKVFTLVKHGLHHHKTNVVIVRGGPGTGKSVIALNLVADLLLEGYNTYHATGSKAFTETLRKVIGSRGSVLFRYFNSFTAAEENEIDVLILDEAHRIRESSNNRFMKKENRSVIPQIQELLKTGKVVVYFIDDAQVVRPNEIGSVEYIKKHAEKYGAVIHEYKLEAQFRCSGSDAFVNWVNNTLGIERSANPLWVGDEKFEFEIFDTPDLLEKAIRDRVTEGSTARITAGFCWPWSKKLDENGQLVKDVTIDGYQRSWNARPEATGLPPNVPKANFWASDPNGLEQIGCIYTAQGFEFDYVGVIFGKDIIYNMERQEWLGHPENSYDSIVKRSKDKFVDLVKNTYRVLLTRGIKGCYVCFLDEETKNFFKSRIESRVW